MNSSVDGVSKVSIIWKNFNIRAHRLTGPGIDAGLKTGRKLRN